MRLLRFALPVPASLLIGLIAFATSSVSVCYGQLTTPEQKGVPSNSSFDGGGIDAVNLQNGNLHISIPLLSAKQRGGGTLQWKFVYDSAALIKQYTPNNCGFPHCSPAGWYAANINTAVRSGWRLVGPFDWTVSNTHNTVTCDTTGTIYGEYTNWTVIDPEGTQHPFPIRTETSYCLGSTSSGIALDGTGMHLDSSTNTIILKDGTTISPGASIQDRNGNISVPGTDTLGRNLFTTTASGGSTYYTIADSSGNPQTFRVDYTTINFNNDACSAVPTPAPPHGSPSSITCSGGVSTMSVPSKLTLPSGRAYTFTYIDNTPGEISEIDLPTGGKIEYTWTEVWQIQLNQRYTAPNLVGGPSVATRKITSGSQVSLWRYNIQPGLAVVTDPLGNVTTHEFSFVTEPTSGTETTSYYETDTTYADNASHVLKSEHIDYASDFDRINNAPSNVRAIRKTLTLDDGEVTKTETDYDTFNYTTYMGSTTGSRLNPTEVRDYDYGSGVSGALLRTTVYSYLHTGSPTYEALNIADRPVTVSVYDGSGILSAETVNEYDNYSRTGQIMQSSGAIHHTSSFGTSFTTRGNITAISKWRNTDGALLTTTNGYDDAGNIRNIKDPGSHTTTLDFTDSWHGTSCVPIGQTVAFATKVTNAKGQFVTSTFNACTGLRASETDANGQTTTYTYDFAGRAKQIDLPDGGQTKTCFTDDPSGSCYALSGLSTLSTTALDGSNSITQTTLFDGLGRAWETQLTSDPEGTVYVDKTFDLLGRESQVSNPYRGADSKFWTTTSYDALSRVHSVTKQDGSISWNNYTGSTTVSVDEAGHKRQSKSDALGRLLTVLEDPDTLNYETDYQYDVNGNVLKVTQKGGSGTSTDWRVRTFTYNSIGQLLCSANPEIGSPSASPATCPVVDSGSYITGTVRYQYNDDGELTSRIAPLPNQTGSSTVTTSLSYDVLHRAIGKSYSDTTPAVSIAFDGDTLSGCSVPTLTGSNLVGRTSAMCDSSGATVWSYDPMGRTLVEEKRIGTVTDQTGYLYYLNGTVKQVTYPSAGATTPFAMNYHVNASGRVDKATGSDSVVYGEVTDTWATGAAKHENRGSNIQLSDAYNSRLQPSSMSAVQVSTMNTLFSRSYDFHLGSGDNGNLFAVMDGLDGLGLSRPNGSVVYTYDAMNRIVTAATLGTDCTVLSGGTKDWGESFTVDPWGNLTNKAVTKCTAESLSSSSDNRNRLAAANYDSAGNIIVKDSVSYVYDAEGRVISGAGTTYVYDGSGERVSKPGKLYWKGSGSTALMETDGTDRNPTLYIFFNGVRIARVDPGATIPKYYVADNLGSTALVTDATGAVLNDSLFFPYGGERVISNLDTGNNYKFTGKERDPETGLDDFGARYYASNIGRFMTPDWDAKPTAVPYATFGDPQTLNLYAYVENAPLNRVDADGHVGGNPNAGVPQLHGINGDDDWACTTSRGHVCTGAEIEAMKFQEDDLQFQANLALQNNTEMASAILAAAVTAEQKAAQANSAPAATQPAPTLPNDPSKLPSGWTDVTPKGGTNSKIPKRYKGPKGSVIEFDPANPKKSPKTWGGRNHWHEVGPDGKRVKRDGEEPHLEPGTPIPGPDGEVPRAAPAAAPAEQKQHHWWDFPTKPVWSALS